MATKRVMDNYKRVLAETGLAGPQGRMITEKEINLLKNALNKGAYPDLAPLVDYLGHPGQCAITTDWTAKGIQWLRRERNRVSCVKLTRAHKATLDGFRSFRFMGFSRVEVGELSLTHDPEGGFSFARRSSWSPVYRVIGTDGNHFDYTYAGGSVLPLTY